MRPWSRRLIAVSAAVALVASIAGAEEPARIQVDDTGFQFCMTPWVVLAAAAATSLTGHQPDYGFRAGMGVRFGR